MNRLEAIIFDVDGTLADTEDTHRRAFNLAFEEFGLDWEWPPPLYTELLTTSGGRERIALYGESMRQEFSSAREYDDFVIDLHRRKTEIYGQLLIAGKVSFRLGVIRLMEEISERGIRLAIATSTALCNVTQLLDYNLEPALQARIECIACADLVREKKPSPAVYQYALDHLQLPAASCCAIEDTENGLKAATAAGLKTVITTHDYTCSHSFPGAALVLDSLGEPGEPFTVAAGDAMGETFVNVALLEKLLALPTPDRIAERAA